MIPKWDKNFDGTKYFAENGRKVNLHLAKLLKCQNPEFTFWHKYETLADEPCGLQVHVLEALRLLTGPQGEVIYKIMLIRHKND